MAPRFFDAEGEPVPYNRSRAIVAATERLNLTTKGPERIDKRPTASWQTAAWTFMDSIGELHFAFSTIGSILSRVRLYVAVVSEADQPPVPHKDFLEAMEDQELHVPHTAQVLDKAVEILASLLNDIDGGVSGMMRSFGINLSVSGEAYLVNVPSTTKAPPHQIGWHVCSTDELVQDGSGFLLRTNRTAQGTTQAKPSDVRLPDNAYAARIWRTHARWRSEPDSSMIGILDDCEQFLLLQQAMRAITRSRMAAGMLYLPEGITSHTASADEVSVEDAIITAATQSVEQESALTTVVPIVIRGPAELADKIKMIEWGRKVDDSMLQQVEESLNRILAGIDFPKEAVSGLVNLRYSNAVVVDDNLFRLHIEPLVLLIVDSLTDVYLQPLLRRALGGPDVDGLVDRIVVWADTSEIVTRPDKSQAANDGYDRGIISADAWRQTRGFTHLDAPTPEEHLIRTVLNRGVLPPDLTQLLFERVDPDWFAAQRGENLGGTPSEITELLAPTGGPEGGEVPMEEEVAPATESGIEGMVEGGPISPNGAVAPTPRR